jgi:multidrug efflux pump subunit AcrA (membrane-fusion protein)
LLLSFGAAEAAGAQQAEEARPEGTRQDRVYNVIEGPTSILFLKPEGSRVKKGDLVCELESFALRTKLAKQESARKVAEAPYRSAKVAREVAELAVAEYQSGVFTPQLKLLENEISLAELGLKQAEQALATLKRRSEKGLATKQQVGGAELKLQKCRLTLEKAHSKKATLEKYTREKTLKELQSKVERARSIELAQQAQLGREQAIEEQLKKEIEHCQVRAPSSGIVHYAEQIEEGADVSKGQLLFRVVAEDTLKKAAAGEVR